MANNQEIDATKEFQRLEGERGASSIGDQRRPSPPGAKLFLVVLTAAVLAAGAFVTWKAMSIMDAVESGESEPSAQEVALNKSGADWQPKPAAPESQPELEPAPEPAPESVTDQAPPAATAQQQPAGPTPEELIRMRRLSSGLNGDPNGSGSQQSPQPYQPDSGTGSGSGPLANNMQPVRLSGAQAGILKNRDMLLTQGSMLDCQLETKIVSTVAGMTTCFTTRDIYSASGRVVLIDRGSKVVGQYQGGMTQGQARIFVLWTRVETPAGVVINLDSPGTGPLGEGGLGGWVDTHFWQRFGGAIMLSMIGDVGEFLSNKASNGDQDRITFENTSEGAEDMAAEALRNSINIPPTLYKNQGERLQIFVARDLDFSGVYSLEPSN